jgi:hypothetical protein
VSRVATRINDVFTHETGYSLVSKRTAAIWPVLAEAVFLEPPEQLKTRFGEFLIHVAATPVEAERFFRAEQDEDGVWWQESINERSADPPSWVARRVFGNVELRWFVSHRKTDWRWLELVRLVEAALSG